MSDEALMSRQARRISASQVRLVVSHPFFAALMMMARSEITEAVETAATDGKTLFFNPHFVEGLAADELDGLIVHEVLHCALLHVPRRRMRDALLWNVAADIHVNGLIRKEKQLRLPKGAIIDAALEELSVEEIYAVLQAEPSPRELNLPDLQDGGGCHDQCASPSAGVEAYWKAAIQRALATVALSRQGSLPANLLRSVRGACDPALDWRTILWRWLVRTPDDFQGFDRRFLWSRVYLEQLEGESVHVDVCIDTSGSVDDRQLDSFLGEVRGILRSYPSVRCRLWYADAACHGPFEVESHERLPAPVGGGGTDFRPFFECVQLAGGDATSGAEPLLVYITDGHGAFPPSAPGRPVLWIVVPGGASNADFPFGEVIRMV
jgi:predicted metal-dependent peptidase